VYHSARKAQAFFSILFFLCSKWRRVNPKRK